LFPDYGRPHGCRLLRSPAHRAKDRHHAVLGGCYRPPLPAAYPSLRRGGRGLGDLWPVFLSFPPDSVGLAADLSRAMRAGASGRNARPCSGTVATFEVTTLRLVGDSPQGRLVARLAGPLVVDRHRLGRGENHSPWHSSWSSGLLPSSWSAGRSSGVGRNGGRVTAP